MILIGELSLWVALLMAAWSTTVSFAGEDDDALKPRTFEKARTCYDASYEVIQVPGGHFMHREHPEVFIPELVKVLQQHEQRVRQ